MRVRGHLVRYRVRGSGAAAVLVHGLGGSARWWARTEPSLAASHRVIVPELPGFGYGLGVAPLRLGEAPDVLGRLLERLEAQPARLVGHSLGALACLALAARWPERVERLVLIAPPVRTAATALWGHAPAALRTVLGLPPDSAATVLCDVLGRSPLALARAGRELLGTDHAHDLTAVRAPTLLVWGGRDALVPPSGAAAVARAIPGARLRLIDGAGHVPMLDRPGELNRELAGFLAAP
jgi:pimeloyl-ACP methyl ester carboxylesterase